MQRLVVEHLVRIAADVDLGRPWRHLRREIERRLHPHHRGHQKKNVPATLESGWRRKIAAGVRGGRDRGRASVVGRRRRRRRRATPTSSRAPSARATPRPDSSSARRASRRGRRCACWTRRRSGRAAASCRRRRRRAARPTLPRRLPNQRRCKKRNQSCAQV